jgi:hypothetical protein
LNKKIGFIVASTLFLVVALFTAPLSFAQIPWDYCQVSAYLSFYEEDSTGSLEWTLFTVATPPSGSEVTNTIYVMNSDTGENYTKNLQNGDSVTIRYDFIIPIKNTVVPASEPDRYIIDYEGEVSNVILNNAAIPEFPPILAVPLFMTATLLAILYRRKRTSQTKSID